MEIHNKRKLLRASPNLVLGSKQKQQPSNNVGVSSCNLSRIADRTQRTDFKQQESILNDFGVLLDRKDQNEHQSQNQDEEKLQIGDNYGKYANKIKGNSESQLFEQKYQKAVQILVNHSEGRLQSCLLVKAFELLQQLLQSLKTKLFRDIKYQLAQSIVLNYWKVASQIYSQKNPTYQQLRQTKKLISKKYINTTQQQLQRVVQSIKKVIDVLQQMLTQQKPRINKLTLLCLVFSKQSLKDKDVGSALQWCQKGFKYCPRFKNTSVLLKLHYLKSKIYQQIHANEPQLQQVKKCLYFLKILSNSSGDNQGFSQQLVRSLTRRRDQLKSIIGGMTIQEGFKFHTYSNSMQKTKSNNGFMAQKSDSLNKFRKRSISFNKLKTINQDNQNNVNMMKTTSKPSLQQQPVKKQTLISSSASNLLSQSKKQFLKLDINRKSKLKKKGQTLTVWQKNSQKIDIQAKIGKQLQKASSNIKQHQQGENKFMNLLLRRPNQKKLLIVQGVEEPKERKIERSSRRSKQSLVYMGLSDNKQFRNVAGNIGQNLLIDKKSQEQKNQRKQQQHQQQDDLVYNLTKKIITGSQNTINTQNDNQLINFISTTQHQLLQRLLTKTMKPSNQVIDYEENNSLEKDEYDSNRQIEFITNQYSQKEFNDRGSQQGMSNALRSKQVQDYAIEEESEDSLNSCTNKKVVRRGYNEQERIVFDNIVCKRQKNSSVVTMYGVIEELSVEVRRKVSSQSSGNNRLRDSLSTNGFIYQVCVLLNGQYYKSQFQFLSQQISERQELKSEEQPLIQDSDPQLQGLEQQFQRWVQKQIKKENSNLNDSPLISIMNKNLQCNIQSYLIQNIVSQIQMSRNPQLGYRLLKQKTTIHYSMNKQTNQQFKISVRERERESVFQWRERNFQYINQSLLFNNTKSNYINTSNPRALLSVHWKSTNSLHVNNFKNISQQDQCKQETGKEQLQSIRIFFIELEKISQQSKIKTEFVDEEVQEINSQEKEKSITQQLQDKQQQVQRHLGDEQKPNPQIYLMRRYNMDYLKTNKHKGIDSYVINRNQHNLQLSENDEDIDISKSREDSEISEVKIIGLDDSEIAPSKFQNQHNAQCLAYQPNHLKLTYLHYAAQQITHSLFPKLKFLQLTQRLSQKQSIQYNSNASTQPKGNKLQTQTQYIQNQTSQFIIKVLGSQPSHNIVRKKGNVRKSQIIQLHQTLNHPNFLKQTIKSKTNLFPQINYNKTTFINSINQIKNNKNQNDSLQEFTPNKERNNPNQMEQQIASSMKHSAMSFYHSTIKNNLSLGSMVKILKKALIQPDYKKSPLLKTYFDSISISSFYNIMGNRPNYIKLTCFRLKSIYVQNGQVMSFYYLFELQQREARTRMHKFIMGDKEVMALFCSCQEITTVKQALRKNKQNTQMIPHSVKPTRTLPYKCKTLMQNKSNEQIHSVVRKVYADSGTYSELKSKKSIFQSQHHQKHNSHQQEMLSPKKETALNFSQQSLTQVMKFITPLFVIKKDYLYTSIYLNSISPIFYLMNKFTIDQQAICAAANQDKLISNSSSGLRNHFHNDAVSRETQLSSQQHNNNLKINSFNSLSLQKTQKSGESTDFLNKEIKTKKILCQKSLILNISKNFVQNLESVQKNRKRKYSHHRTQQAQNVPKSNSPHTQSRFSQKRKEWNQEESVRNQEERRSLFSILTIIKISKSEYFTIKLYIPKFQRSYSLTLDKSFINYLELNDFKYIFKDAIQAESIIEQLQKVWNSIQSQNRNTSNQRLKNQQQHINQSFTQLDANMHKSLLIQRLSFLLFEDQCNHQKILWKNVLSLIEIEQKNTEDKVYLIMKISNFNGFIKDCSFLEFFQKDSSIYMIEMSISKKSQNCQYFPKQDFIESLEGNKIKRGILSGKNRFQYKERKVRGNKGKENQSKNQTKSHFHKRVIDTEHINCHNQVFQKIGLIYQSKTQDYTLYVQIFKIYQESQQIEKKTDQNNNSQHLDNEKKEIEKQEQEIDYELISAKDSSSPINYDTVNNSEREREAFSPDSKQNCKFTRTQMFRKTIKSNQKSIKFNVTPKLNQKNGYFLRNKRSNSNYNLLNKEILSEADQREVDQITKINFSFYLSQLNHLFKYIDQNYSEEFNEEYFILSQMNTGFKILGNIFVEEFKSLKNRNNKTLGSIQRKQTIVEKEVKSTQRQKITIGENANLIQKNKMSFKKSLVKKMSQKLLFEDMIMNLGEQEEYNKDKLQQKIKDKEANINKSFSRANRLNFSTKQLFYQHESQKKFKQRIIDRLQQFNDKLKQLEQSACNEMDFVKDEVLSLKNQEMRLKISESVNSQTKSKQRPNFISLHSQLPHSSLIDLHVIPNQKSNQMSSLFFQYDSLLFLISNVQSYEIFTVSIKLDQQNPFSFIKTLSQKGQLNCIRNRLFKFYKNLLLLMKRH